ncbi:hypothetical protein [Nonomuraea turcica]|uniref:hypothetical protein n=1 Tax=Nonomuraea sp. G32 TaxID=3067274 RepID=UPI00273AF6BD|nr:hypothetical protein [Nonomuraea sp. G32]MDP4502867.1 hypothetical protein [Nonomuraea sp. G32]
MISDRAQTLPAVLALHGRAGAAGNQRLVEELPMTRSLASPKLRETFAQRERRRWAADPERWAQFPGDAERMAMVRPLSAAAIAENKHRAGYQLIGRELTWHASQVRSRRIRAAHDARAQAVGYPDIVGLLTATTHLTCTKIGEMIGLTRGQVQELRRRYGIRSTSRSQGRLMPD